MGAPRADRATKTAIVEYRGKQYPVEYVGLTDAVDSECQDEATITNAQGGKFLPAKYLRGKMRRMVTKIADEPVNPGSPLWLELPDGFGMAMRRALFPDEDEFFRGDEEDSAGPRNIQPTGQ